MIGLKHAYAPAERVDACRFLVDRVWPRGRRKGELQLVAWLKEALHLAHTVELADRYGVVWMARLLAAVLGEARVACFGGAL